MVVVAVVGCVEKELCYHDHTAALAGMDMDAPAGSDAAVVAADDDTTGDAADEIEKDSALTADDTSRCYFPSCPNRTTCWR